MKLFKKSECSFKHGMIIGPDNETLCVSNAVHRQLDTLDTVFQKYNYLKGQAPYHEAPSLDGFERIRQNQVERKWAKVEKPDTPMLDQAVKETMQFIDELSATESVDKVNLALEKYCDLLDFCADDEFAAHYGDNVINCVSLGNPLKLAPDDVIGIITMIATGDVDG